MDPVQKLSKPYDLAFDAFAVTHYISKVRILLHKHQRVVTSEKDSSCVEMSITVLVQLYASQLLNNESKLESGN